MVETLQQILPGFLIPYLEMALQLGQSIFGSAWENILTTLWTVIKVMLIIAPLLLVVAYVTFWERKFIGWMQVRIGPNRVGPWGLIQPIADGLKLMLKEVVIPAGADKSVFLIAPLLAFAPALMAWAVIPFNDVMVLADINASLLYIMAVTSISVYGIILAGWASNSKYAFLGGMRSAAQLISYEVAMGLALVVVPAFRGRAVLPTWAWASCRGTGCRCCRCLWSTWCRSSPKPTAHRSTWPKASRKSSVSTSSIRAWPLPCSRSPSMPRCCSARR